MKNNENNDNNENNKKSKSTVLKHSILDKIVFFALAVASVVLFIFDVAKDFIPDEYWQLKFLIIVVGALSGFFGVMSFFWDKKFLNVSNEIIAANDSRLDTLTSEINLFIQEHEESKYFDSFNEAILPLIGAKQEFDEVCIFAYSAKNYVDCLLRSSTKIKHLRLCLHRANDFSAWFIGGEARVGKYKHELEKVLEDLETLNERHQVASYDVRFYDFESYSHFGIFDDQILMGELIPLFSEKKTVQIGKIQTMKRIGSNENLFINKMAFFNSLFAGSVVDSGLMLLRSSGCHYCDTCKILLDPHHIIDNHNVKMGRCDISLIRDTTKISDFLLEPDFHPISELHMLLVCKFHILNLFDYLNHKNAIRNFMKLAYVIRNVVYEETGQEILFFEHGTSSQNSELSASSIEHLHVHIIFEPKEYNYIDAIFQDNREQTNPIIDNERGAIKFSSLEEFAQEGSLRNRDYFMIWKLGQDPSQSEIYVWFPIKKESQYLRRIFFQGLSQEEKEKLYIEESDGHFDDEYDWKHHHFNYTDERLAFHKKIGENIYGKLE